MNILHINSYYAGSRFYKNFFDKQVKNGINISVFVPVPFSNNVHPKELGSYTMVSANHNKFDRFMFHIKHHKIYTDLISKYDDKLKEYSLIHAHSLFSNGYIAFKLKRKFKLPYIVAVRNTDINYFFKGMPHLRKLGVKILLEAEAIILLSEPYKNLLLEKYVPQELKLKIDNKIKLIPNGIDDYWFQNIGVKKGKNIKDSIKLLHVGVINKNKNIITTIKAIEVLKQKGYDISYTLVGKMQNKKIYRKIKDLPYINYISPKPKEELIKIYRENDILVMPSITETFGLVYAEAMSQGLPVIYSRGQGFDRQFKDGLVGFSVESNNHNEIVLKIINIIENYEAISERNLNLVEKFKWDNIIKEYEQIYSSSIN